MFLSSIGIEDMRQHSSLRLLTACIAAVILSGCGGEAADPETHEPEVTPTVESVGPMPLRRLNLREYDNTVRDLLKLNFKPSDEYQFATDLGGEFDYPSVTESTSPLEVRKYEEAAEAIAEQIDISSIFVCSGSDQLCAEQFIQNFVFKAYRRPLTENEVARFLAFYNQSRIEPLNLEHEESLKLIVQAVLQSPSFLYRWESSNTLPTVENGAIKLNDYEVASRLSYFIWRSMPDANLFQAAANGELSTRQQVEAQARRLLADEKALDPIISFFEYWLQYSDLMNKSKDQTTYPNFDDDLKQAMLAEARAYIKNIVFDGDQQFESLFSSAESFVNNELASIYDLDNIFSNTLQATSLNQNQRGGILTLPAFLADKGAADGSNPALRGAVLYEQLLCDHLPPPPNAIPAIEPPSAGGTTRDRFETHTGNPCASACHALFDPIGFAFESYDGIGQFRTTDNGLPVDSSSVINLDGTLHSFDGAVEFSEVLANSTEVKTCFARQWVRYALDRNEVDNLDEPSISKIAQDFVASGDIQELIISITTSDSFLYRKPMSGEDLAL